MGFSLPRSWRRLLRLPGSDLSAQLDQELAFHVEMRVADYVARGMTPAEARRHVRQRFGDMELLRDECLEIDRRRTRAVRRAEFAHEIWQDLRFAGRTMRRGPGFAAVAALTLALGIGATTAVFSVVNGVLLAPLPGRDPERLVVLWETTRDIPEITVSYQNYRDWQRRTRTFEQIAVYNPWDEFTMTGRGDPERVRVGLASGNLLDVVGIAPSLGRGFRPEDDRPGAERVAVLTDGFWRRRFGADASVVGRTITLDANSYSVVGVLPEAFRLGNMEVWVPVGPFTADTLRYTRGNHPGLVGLGRLKPAVTIDRMRADLGAVARQLEREHPDVNDGIGASGAPLREIVVGGIRPALLVFSGAVALVLLIACANVANLLLGRAATRQRELAVRVALGAGRGRIARQLLTESLALALVGGAAGLGLAWAGVKLLMTLRPSNVPRLAEIGIDGTVLAFALVTSLLTGILFGLAPVAHATRRDVVTGLKEEDRGATAGRARLRFRTGLLVAEVAIALVLLANAGLLLRSFARLTSVDPGVDPRNVVIAEIQLPERTYPSEVRRRAVFDELRRRVAALPGIEDAALSTDIPLSSSWQSGVTVEGRQSGQGPDPLVNGVIATPEYFRTMRMRLLAGRGLEPRDAAGRAKVAVVSETVMRRLFGGQSPVGRRIRIGDADSAWMTIVGVVNDVKDNGLARETRGAMYVPLAQWNAGSLWLMVRTRVGADRVVPLLRRELAAVDDRVPLAHVQTMEEAIAGSVGQPRFSMLMLVVFASLALLLAAAGIYGVISYSVAQRTHEIGVRVALGARGADVLGMVIRQVVALTLAGIAIGSAAALAGGRVIASLLFGVSPSDPLTLAAVSVLVLAVAIIATAVPAIRAARTDPIRALRGA